MRTRLPFLAITSFSSLLLGCVLAAAQQRPIPMPDKDFEAFKKCAESAGQVRIDACNYYLKTYPASSGTQSTLEVLLTAYDEANDSTNLLATADKLIALNPTNLRALAFESSIHMEAADKLADSHAKRAELEQAARYARTGLEAEKPATVSESEWDVLRDATRPVFEAVISRVKLWGLDQG